MATDERSALAQGLVEQAGALAAGEVRSVELVERSLEAIEATAEILNAFRCVRVEAALAEAAEADRRLAAGERAPLLGVPVAIKDDIDLAGETTPFGCEGDWEVREGDAELVRRLRAAGAVIVGKTNTPELGQWPVSEGPGFGVVRNPWSPGHGPGGSSGGSAAAVAAGLVAAAVGSDGAGSVRIPASWTNLVGIKPQRGRVSTWPAPEAFNGLTCNGPLARTVADAALMLDALSGNHPNELHRPPPPAEPYAAAARREPPPLRVALSFRIPFSGAPAELDPRVGERVGELAADIAGLGHSVTEQDPAWGVVGASFLPRAAAGVAEWAARAPSTEVLDPRTRESARNGRLLGGPVLRAARASEGIFRRRIGAIFRDFDLLVMPTTAQPPPPVGAIDGLSLWETDRVIVAACPYAWPWNVLGWPAISVPAGFVAGLPVGAQLLGPGGSEPLLLSVAAQLERVRRWDLERPPGFGG
jgi:amidase